MAKPKKYISSKLKPKRKFVLGGNPEQELYLNDNVTYQAKDGPTQQMQQDFNARQQARAEQMANLQQSMVNQQMMANRAANAAEEERKKKEETARQQQAEANKQTVNKQVTQTAGKASKKLFADYKAGALGLGNTDMLGNSTNIFSSGNVASGAPLSPTVGPNVGAPGIEYSHLGQFQLNPASSSKLTSLNYSPSAQPSAVNQFMPQGLDQGVVNTGQVVTKTGSSFGQSAAAIGKSVGGAALVAAPAIIGQVASNQLNAAADRDLKNEGRSQYFDDTEFSRKEFNAQLLKSTGQGATIGGTIASAIPIPGVATGAGMAIGAVVGAGVGLGKAMHQRRMTKTEDERGVKIGNKRFGKKLLFGEENAYDENLDPTVIAEREQQKRIAALANTATAMDNARLSSMTQYDTNTGFNLKTTTGQMAKYGGKIEYLKGGVAKSLGRGAKEYIGKSHEEGGIDLPGNIEVEGGETEQNNYIFSKHLKLHTGISYAQAHKNLLKSGASPEEIKQLALSQEAAAGRNPNEIKTMKFAKYGGPLRYDDGGKKDPTTQDKIISIITSSGLSAEEFAKQTGVDPEVIKGIQAGTINLNPDEQEMLLAAIPSTLTTTTDNNPPADQTIANTNTNIPTTTYITSDKVTTDTKPKDTKPRFFMGASRIVDENGNVQILTDRPLMGTGAMSGSRLGTPGPEGLESVRSNSYDAAGKLKIGAEYKDKKTGANLSSSNAVNDRETIAGTEWGKRWGYKPGMSAAEAKAAHDAFASEMRTKFDQSPEEMLGYYQYLIDSGKVDPETGKRDYTGEDSFGDDARAIYENLQSKGYIDADGKIKKEALPYLKTQATNEFVGPIHNAAGAYSLKGSPTPIKIPGDIPKDDISIPPPPKKDSSIDLDTPLPPLPEYRDPNIGWIQGLPAVGAMFSNVKPANYTPELASGYVQPGAIGRANIGRVSYNTERALVQDTYNATNQALQNMSGPGAIAGMLAAKTKANQQNLAIANAEQNANIVLAAKEADLNANISKFNVGTAMQAQTTNAGLGVQNAAMQNDARKFNTGARMQADMYNLETKLGAGEKAVNTIAQYDMDNRQLKATERYAKATDYSGALNREQVYNDLKRASQDPNNKDFYGKSEAELWDYTRRYDKQMYGDRGNVIITNNTANKEEQKKFGGAKKYISRLGDLKNVKYKV